MGVFVVGLSNAAGQSAGTTTTASTVSVTPTLPTFTTTQPAVPGGSASGDRIFVFQAANNTSGTTPASWTALFKDTVIGSGVAGAGTGQRWLSCYYRDYDGVWTMPAFTLTSAAQNTQALGAITVRKGAFDTWDTPTASGVGNDFGTADTSFAATTASFTTVSGALLMAPSCTNDNVTMNAGATITGTNGFVSGTVAERVDGGNATGNDVSLRLHTCSPPTAASPAGTLTLTGTLSAASEGGVIFVQQTSTHTSRPAPQFESSGEIMHEFAANATIAMPVPPGTVANDIIVASIYIENGTQTITPPSGFTEAADSPMTIASGSTHSHHVYWKRATGADSGTYDFATTTVSMGGYTSAALRFSGCITTGNPFDFTVSDLLASTGVTAGNFPTLTDTTDVPNTLMVWWATHFNTAAVVTKPSGFQLDCQGDRTYFGVNYAASGELTARGSSGSIIGSYTGGGTTASITAWMGALRPPATVTTNRSLSVAVRRAGFY